MQRAKVVSATSAADILIGETCLWSEYKTQIQAEGRLERGPCRNVGIVCIAFKFQPGSVADGRDLLGCGGRSWSWTEGCLTPSCFPPVLLPFCGYLQHSFNADFPVVLFPPKDKPNGSWGRLWTAVGMDLAFIMTWTATAQSRSSSSLQLKSVWSSAKEGKR